MTDIQAIACALAIGGAMIFFLGGCSACQVDVGDVVSLQGRTGSVKSIERGGSWTSNCRANIVWTDGSYDTEPAWALTVLEGWE